jgi:hypothetical protein
MGSDLSQLTPNSQIDKRMDDMDVDCDDVGEKDMTDEVGNEKDKGDTDVDDGIDESRG